MCTGCDIALKVEVQVSNLAVTAWGGGGSNLVSMWRSSCIEGVVVVVVVVGEEEEYRDGMIILNHSCRLSCCLVLCGVPGCDIECDFEGGSFLHH